MLISARGETGLDAIRSNYFTLAKRLLLVAGPYSRGAHTREDAKGTSGIIHTHTGGNSGERAAKDIRMAGCEVSGWALVSKMHATHTPPLHEASLSCNQRSIPLISCRWPRVAATALCKNRLTHLLEDACLPIQYKYIFIRMLAV